MSLADEHRRKFEYADEALRALHRMILFGNGGGVIATLGLIGTIVGSSPDHRFDRAVFVVLLLFVAGLFASGVGNYYFSKGAEILLKKSPGAAQAGAWRVGMAFLIGFLFLAAGTILGLIDLWSLTR